MQAVILRKVPLDTPLTQSLWYGAMVEEMPWAETGFWRGPRGRDTSAQETIGVGPHGHPLSYKAPGWRTGEEPTGAGGLAPLGMAGGRLRLKPGLTDHESARS